MFIERFGLYLLPWLMRNFGIQFFLRLISWRDGEKKKGHLFRFKEKNALEIPKEKEYHVRLEICTVSWKMYSKPCSSQFAPVFSFLHHVC